jgi:hypothetical protein
MKHLLNDLSEEEKNRIREQHTGGKKIMIENFDKLVNNKLGDVKVMVNEEENFGGRLSEPIQDLKHEIHDLLDKDEYRNIDESEVHDLFQFFANTFRKRKTGFFK